MAQGKRKVRLAGGLDGDCMIILTDAPMEAIQSWITEYNAALEDGKNIYFDGLSKKHYVKVLHDSDEDPRENARTIGWDESYDLNDCRMEESWECVKEKLIDVFEDALGIAGFKVLDGDRNSFIVENYGLGPDFLVTVGEA